MHLLSRLGLPFKGANQGIRGHYKRPSASGKGEIKMPECPNCGFDWEYCVNCGEPCSNDEGATKSVLHGEYNVEDGGYICDNCKDKDAEDGEDNEVEEGEGE